MVRNGEKLYFPVAESIKSILPICEEFVVTVGKGDTDDRTREVIANIDSPKVRIIDTDWDNYSQEYHGQIHAIQTDLAMQECSGDWLFYLQADEVVHEKYLPVIKARCEELLDDKEIEGLLFNYKHFWGDYNHYQNGHGWYSKEIRIVRNGIGVSSHRSAQSFRRNGEKLKVAEVDAEIYHYGWVRPPRLMQNKRLAIEINHWGREKAEAKFKDSPPKFDYGPLNRLEEFRDTHPEVMREMIEAMDWKDDLQYSGPPDPERAPHKHELLKYRFLSFLENRLLNGKKLGEYKNYRLLRR